MSNSSIKRINVNTPSRLHLGFIDLHGGVGRKFGSVGIALETPRLELEINPADALKIQGANNERIRQSVEVFDKHYRVVSHCRINVLQAVPEHRGLGSGTQIALAVGHGLAELHGLDLSTDEIAACLGRGRRSGIGLYAFGNGGVLVDAGIKSNHMPTLIFRQPFPESWRILLITAEGDSGLHGVGERAAFERLPQFSKSCAGALSRTVLMKLMPALIEQDFESFSQAVRKMQDAMNDYFSSVQKAKTSELNFRLLEYLNAKGIKGTGQTSWGPTTFAIIESQAQAAALKAELIDYVRSRRRTETVVRGDTEQRNFLIVKGDNRGAAVVSN